MNMQQMITRSPFSLLGLIGLFLFASPVAAQVFDLGPSDPELFENVINVSNVPGDPNIGDGQSVGGSTQINVFAGGSVGFLFVANSGSELNISGGSLGSSFDANSGSEVNISDGTVGTGVDANSGSVVNISGGTVGDLFDANTGSLVNISGGEVGNSFDANGGSEINISGGSVGSGFNTSTVVNISGGSVGEDFDAFSGSVVTISGGSVGDLFDANPGSVINIDGGEVGAGFEALAGSEVNITAGSVGAGFAASGSVNLFGSEFAVNGEPLAELMIDETVTIADRDVTFSGEFTDGSPFSFDLNSTNVDGEDFFGPNATLTVTFILILGDVNQDGVVDFVDIGPFIELLQTGVFLDEADINRDGEVNFSDIIPFIELLIST